jgi:hypothetical protein
MPVATEYPQLPVRKAQAGDLEAWERLAEHKWSDAQLVEIEQRLGQVNLLADAAMRGERAMNIPNEPPGSGSGRLAPSNDAQHLASSHNPVPSAALPRTSRTCPTVAASTLNRLLAAQCSEKSRLPLRLTSILPRKPSHRLEVHHLLQ